MVATAAKQHPWHWPLALVVVPSGRPCCPSHLAGRQGCRRRAERNQVGKVRDGPPAATNLYRGLGHRSARRWSGTSTLLQQFAMGWPPVFHTGAGRATSGELAQLSAGSPFAADRTPAPHRGMPYLSVVGAPARVAAKLLAGLPVCGVSLGRLGFPAESRLSPNVSELDAAPCARPAGAVGRRSRCGRLWGERDRERPAGPASRVGAHPSGGAGQSGGTPGRCGSRDSEGAAVG